MTTINKQAGKDLRHRSDFARKLRRSIPYYVLILLPLAVLLIFKYYPMYGVTLAFKDYRVSAGIAGSPWTQPLFRHFTRFLTAPSAVRVITNTFTISLYSLLAGFPFPILLAIGLNELRSKKLKKTMQMITFMTGANSVDNYESWLQEARDLGLDQLIGYYQAAYDAQVK